MTVKDKETAEKLTLALFAETAAADVQENHDGISRMFKNTGLLHTGYQGLLHVDKDQRRLHMVTTDDRVAEVLELAYSITKDPKLPALVTTIDDAGKEYVAWVRKQAEANDDDGAFYNKDPFDKSKPIAKEAISKMEDHEKKEKQSEAKDATELEQEAREKAKEAQQAEEEEKADEAEKKLKEAAAPTAAAAAAAETATAAAAQKAAAKAGIFKTSEDAANALAASPAGRAAAQEHQAADNDDLQL